MSEKKSLFDNLSPQQTFVVGLVGGFLVVCTIGFFLLLNKYMAGEFPAAGTNTPSAVNNNAPTAPTQPAPAAVAAAKPAAVTSAGRVRGNAKADITIIEYSDIECPFCQRFHDTMLDVMTRYGDDVRWVYRHFPLTSIHPNATCAAIAAECAGEQGRFWEFVDAAFEGQQINGVGVTAQKAIAADLGLNQNAFEACLTSGKFTAKVTADTNDATATGGRGTPHTIIVNADGETRLISGAQPAAVIEQAIEALK